MEFRLHMLRDNWPAIRSNWQLHRLLTRASDRLCELGHADLAKRWRHRTDCMPVKIGKEAINIVLLSACWELERLNIVD